MNPFEVTWDLLAHQGELHWMSKKADGRRYAGIARSPEQLAKLERSSERGADVYVQLNPAEGLKAGRATKSDITHFRGVLVDLDPVPGRVVSVTPERDPDAMIDAYRRVRQDTMASVVLGLSEKLGFLPKPWVIDSGRGVQAWLLGAPVRPSAPGWKEAVRRGHRSIIEAISTPSGYVLDPKVCDVARVVRLPGTINQKTGERAYFVSRGEPVNGLLELVLRHDPGEAEPELGTDRPESVDSYMHVWTNLTGTAQTFITRGFTYPGRHTVMWHTADVLCREGLTREAVERALLLGARVSTPPLSREEVRYAIKRAWERKVLDRTSREV